MNIRNLTIKTMLSAILLGITITAGAQDAKYYIGKGAQAAAIKDYDLAISNYTLAISLDGGIAEAYNKRGLAYRYKEEYVKAVLDYNKAIELDPAYTEVYINRGNVYYKKNSYALAIKDFSKAINLSPVNIGPYFNRGAIYWNQKKYDSAIVDFSSVIALSPNYSSAYFNRGNSYLKNGVYERAISDYDKALILDASNNKVFEVRGIAYWFMDNYDQAISDLSKAISIDPGSASIYNNRGLAYNDKGEYEPAIADFKKAVELDDKESFAYINIISALTRLHRFNEAAEYYRSCQDKGLSTFIDGDSSWAFFNKYVEAITEGINKHYYPGALMLLEAAEKLYAGTAAIAIPSQKRSFANILALKGFVEEHIGALKRARYTYEQALVINPNQPDIIAALENLGVKQQEFVLQDKKPPGIELISPQASRSFDIESDDDTTQLIGKARDESGIASVNINGVDADKLEEDGLFISRFILRPGANVITITATDKQGNSSSKTFNIMGAVAKNKKTEFDIPAISEKLSQYYAILIAEKDYQDNAIPNLQNPVKDAGELKEILLNNYTFSSEHIDTLYNRNREDIMQAIVQRCNTLTDNDNLVIFYAGHGTAIKDQFGDVDGYWIPVSAKRGLVASYISAEDINKALKQSKARHILLLADACFSGAFTRELPSDANKAIQRQYKVPSRKVMASGNLEPVPDNSRFLYYLKKSLLDNPEKYLSAKKLFDSFYEAIINNSENLPQYAAIKNVGDEGGEFVFIKR